METNTTVENLRAEHARLDAIIREEESHIWKNLIRIEAPLFAESIKFLSP